MLKMEISPGSLSMRTHHKVCCKPGYPDHNHNVGPHWLEPFTCTVVLLPFHSCTVSPSRSKDRCTVCSSPELLGTGGSQLFLHEPETSTVGASVAITPRLLSSIQRVFHPAGGPSWTPFSFRDEADAWTSTRGHGQGPGFNPSEEEAEGGLKLFPLFRSFDLTFLRLCLSRTQRTQEITFLFWGRWLIIHLLSDKIDLHFY